ncbi:hypothetical protein [Pseudemcibacter aquimaris]|uniref:hypothetical protein n=1 Tax=Pseudemcibacter aquimaris TaxID=2857064 RepID=UPI0020114094|nr:hypothetical protein [Pseudemcibacter aquimaris]MCC3860203.1 hypothetical protein [Pseudemcibacter aquimaris]WDU57528.1 hypothetical protein KW060_10010 [Pseudemcibacter aquimaris]
MKKLKLSDWTSIAEIIGMVAVIISLIFVGFEIRQNTAQVEAASMKSSYNFIDLVYKLGGDPASNEIIIRALNDFDDLTIGEKALFDSYITTIGMEFDVAHDLYQRGFLDEELYLTYEELWARVMMSPGSKEMFEITRQGAPPEIQRMTDMVIVKYAHLDPLSEYYKFEPGYK